MLNELGLFAGIGGISLGLERAGLCIPSCFVEIDPYAQKVLAKQWPQVPIWDDVCSFSAPTWSFDIITGGFPCQDISVAGKGAGLDGGRSGLWFEFKRIIGEVRPRIVLIENVPMLTVRGGVRVVADLAEIGYDAEWGIVSAADVIWLGSYPKLPAFYHRRKRMFIIAFADADSEGGLQPKGGFTHERKRAKNRGHETADAERRGCEGGIQQRTWPETIIIAEKHRLSGKQEFWEAWRCEPELERMVDGIPHRLDRSVCLGNAVVPQVAEHIGNLIMRRIHEH